MPGVIKTLILCSRFVYLPAGACRGRYTNSLHLLPYNFQTVHGIFKNFISTCSGDCFKSPDVGHAKWPSGKFFCYNPKYAKPTFANSSQDFPRICIKLGTYSLQIDLTKIYRKKFSIATIARLINRRVSEASQLNMKSSISYPKYNLFVPTFRYLSGIPLKRQ